MLELKNLPIHSFNTLVIGSGAAGLSAAVALRERGVVDVAILTERWGAGTSNNAGSDKQTYYKQALTGDISDSPRLMADDLFRGGCMHGDIALCEAQNSLAAFFRLVELGVPFPHDAYGGFHGYKTDHDPRSRATSAGPLTSRNMFEAFARDIERRGIKVFDGHQVVALLTRDEAGERSVIGAVAIDFDRRSDDDPGFTLFNARNVILATGGPASLYRDSVYPVSQTGAHGLGLRIGATAQNLSESQFGLASIKFRWNVSGSYQQVIPRYVSTTPDGSDEREFLSEVFPTPSALAQATFLKGYQWPFDPRKIDDWGSSLIDLLVFRETRLRGRRVYMDFRVNPRGFRIEDLGGAAGDYLRKSGALQAAPIERLTAMNPAAAQLYRAHNIDLNAEPLEVAVCAQHCNGGLTGNLWWESNIRHLFPIGEVNGTHGVYRPGGAALNAGQVGALRAATFIAHRCAEAPANVTEFRKLVKSQIVELLDQTRRRLNPAAKTSRLFSHRARLQTLMTNHAGIIRRREDVRQSLQDVRALRDEIDHQTSFKTNEELGEWFRLRDDALTAEAILSAIGEYLNHGGQSRGSYLALGEGGSLQPADFDESWRFELADGETECQRLIQEITYTPHDGFQSRWVDPRPIPDQESWFEKVWADYREDRVVRVRPIIQ